MVLYRSPDLIKLKQFSVFFLLYESMKKSDPRRAFIFDPRARIWTILVEVH